MCDYDELVRKQPLLAKYSNEIPAKSDGSFHVQEFPEQTTLYEKGAAIKHINILLSGNCRAVDDRITGEFFVVEKKKPVSFIGVIEYLSNITTAYYRVETISDCIIASIPTAQFHIWLTADNFFFRKLCAEQMKNLYLQSLVRSEASYLSTKYILYRYILLELESGNPSYPDVFSINKTRLEMSNETGIPVKTINRTIVSFVQDGSVSIVRGKVVLSAQQYSRHEQLLNQYYQLSRNGRNVGII
jgi:CRP-like cAMP-binding protein